MNGLSIKELQKDLPQLIVALDSLDDSANYIHVKDAKENMIYYCPCCKRTVKPRAYKDDREYQYQAHYYHENGGCNEETFVHYICKTWLFESGCKFKIDDNIYTVDRIETEKTYHTNFGDYRPDITVYTTECKIFFFEIKSTNKKTENYIPKWDALGNDVVEVDVRYFINQKIDSNIPEFKLIYSDGECFIKSYSRNDYEETIARRKMEWKRQDKLNYKMMWENLDWFWIEVQKYKNDPNNANNLLDAFKSLDFYDTEDCWNIINKMSCCKNLKDDFRNIVNDKSKQKCNELLKEIKSKFENKLESIDVFCEPKKDLYLSFRLSEVYRKYSYGEEILYYYNKSWTILPSMVLELFNRFKQDYELLIIKHCDTVDKLQNYYTWNRAPMLYDYFLFGSYLKVDINEYDKYLDDAEKIIEKTNNKIIDELSKYYKNNFCMTKYEIFNYINDYLCKFKLIYDLLHLHTNDGVYCIAYKDIKIMSFIINDDAIKYKNEILYYTFAKKDITQKFIKNCIDSDIYELINNIPIIEMMSEIYQYSNETWRFDFDIEKQSIIITLNYLIPYYDKYKKQVSQNKYIDISYMFNDNFHLDDYHKEINNLLNNIIAPAMDTLIDEVIENYNKSHINSALCRYSEVTRYNNDK